MAKQVIDIMPTKGMTAAQSNEHLRKYSEGAYQNMRSNNFDPTRAHLGFEVTTGGKIVPIDVNHSIPERMKENLAARGIKDPNEGLEEPMYRTIANIILGGSREQMRRLAFGNQDVNFNLGADNSHIIREKGIEEWAKDTYDFMTRKFGEENILAFIVHLDETNPHVHCTVMPINSKNKFSWKSYFGKSKEEGRKKFQEMHDSLSEVNRKYGLDRGDNIHETGAKPRTTEEYKQWLWEECNRLEKEADGKRMVIRMLDEEIRHAKIKIKGLTTMINNLNEKKNNLLKEVDSLEQQYRNGAITIEEMNSKTEKLRAQIKDIEAKIADNEDKLDDAKQKLQEVNIKKASAKIEVEDLQRKLNTDLPKWQDKVMKNIESYGWKEAARDIKEQLEERLSEDEMDHVSDIMDDSMFDMMTNSASEVIATATALFFGYIEQATEIAQGGGGGGSVGSGWGRDDDDDDDKWMKKCFKGACRMMQKPPVPQRHWRRRR